MFDKNRLKAYMTLRGKTARDVAQRLGITEVTLRAKMNNDGNFTRREILILIEYLGIGDPMGVFFAKELAETQVMD